MASPLLIRSLTCRGIAGRTLGRVARSPADAHERGSTFLALSVGDPDPGPDAVAGHAAVLLERGRRRGPEWPDTLPSVEEIPSLESLAEDTLVALDPRARALHLLFRPDSPHNALFVTNRCNSRCVMCPQPPTVQDDSWLMEEALRLIGLMRRGPEALGITGGEPTLLGPGLLRVLDALKERFPETCLYLLTNGRLLAYWDYATALAGVGHRRLTVEVPLYADTADLHDRIVGAAGAFDQAIAGLYNLARLGQTIRLRVVLGKETLPRLGALMEFVYRNLPFVAEVALMGMEPMGYVKKNWDRVWIDPLDYAAALEAAVRHGALRGMPVSLFNLPLCLLPRGLWAYARKSISDYKNVFLPECDACSVHGECSGMFASERLRHGLSGIRAVSQHS